MLAGGGRSGGGWNDRKSGCRGRIRGGCRIARIGINIHMLEKEGGREREREKEGG